MAGTRSSWTSGDARLGPHAERAIVVAPVQGGWRVTAGACEALMFLSGGCAERQARILATRFADLGYDARIEIHDRNDAVAGDLRYRGAPRHDRQPSARA